MNSLREIAQCYDEINDINSLLDPPRKDEMRDSLIRLRILISRLDCAIRALQMTKREE